MRRSTTIRPDPVTEAALLEIDGRKYHLVYDFNAIAEAEAGAGCNLLHGISATLLNTMTAAQLRGLLFAALRRNHAEMTLSETGALIRIDTMTGIVKAISKAMALSMARTKNPTGAAGAAAPN